MLEFTAMDFKGMILNEVKKNKFAMNEKTRKIETMKKKQVGVLELKNWISEVKTLLAGLNNRMGTTKENSVNL